MKPSEARDLANEIRGLSTAVQVIGKALMTTNAIRGRQLLKVSDTMDLMAERVHRKWADGIQVQVKVAYLMEMGTIVAVLPEMVERNSHTSVACYAMLGQHSTGSIKYFRELPKAEDSEAKAAFVRHFATLYECIDLVEVDIHETMEWEKL